MHQIIENTLLNKIKTLLDPSSNMSQRELTNALNKIIKKFTINNAYDVPYLTGFSQDGKTIYIDRRIPKFIAHDKTKYNIYSFLILHEVIEKALVQMLGSDYYQLAHEVATRAIYAAVTGEKLSYPLYSHFLQEKLAKINAEENYVIPPKLDLLPYVISKDKKLLHKIKHSLKIKWMKKDDISLNKQPEIIHRLIKPMGNFPNNPKLPLLVYKQALMLNNASVATIKKFLKKNGWHSLWVDGMYNYHHYHSNTHEALVIYSGQCLAQIGGTQGQEVSLSTGDVIIFPAGVSHKRIKASDDFKSIGCYPYAVEYDIHVGTALKSSTLENIKEVKLPKTDPIYGKQGPLIKYWHIR